jgi:hypothetical protein
MIHQIRQKRLLSQLAKNALVIVSTNPEQWRNGDVHYPFRPHSDFWYLTGPCFTLLHCQLVSVCGNISGFLH